MRFTNAIDRKSEKESDEKQLSFPFSFTGVCRVRRKGLRNGNTFDRFSFLRATSSSSDQFNLKTFHAKAPRFSTNNVTKQYPIAAKRNYSNSLLASVYEYYLPLKNNKKTQQYPCNTSVSNALQRNDINLKRHLCGVSQIGQSSPQENVSTKKFSRNSLAIATCTSSSASLQRLDECHANFS